MKSYVLVALATFLVPVALGFESGSTGADGNFNPTVNTSLVIPDDGVLNFATINIPEGVTVRFIGNRANTPAYVLVQGDAVIDGIIDMNGVNGGEIGIAPAGGYLGGLPQASGLQGGTGQGPGGGEGAPNSGCGGYGAGYFTRGSGSQCTGGYQPGGSYGSGTLQPLVGGSGGGAGNLLSSGLRVTGLAGGGGGGAFLLAVSGTLSLNGSILARGGNGEADEDNRPSNSGIGGGGGGSGGGVRVVATSLIGNGVIEVNGGAGGIMIAPTSGTDGSPGRARIEVESFQFTGSVLPLGILTSSAPLPLFLAQFPVVRITTIAGQAVPLNPTGENDLILPTSTANPVTIEFETSNVPVGSSIQLVLTPINGAIVNAASDALSGTLEQATASLQIDLPQGPSTLIASVAFVPNALQTNALARFTGNKKITNVELSSELGVGSQLKVHLENGKVLNIPVNQLPM